VDVGTLSVGVIGRAAELRALAAFAREIEDGSAVLVLEGDAGVGKTTLWRAALDSAGERGWRVLAARPASAEASLALAGLGDLLADALDDVLEVLPSPQAEALRVALLLERPRAPLDARLLGVSTVSALRALQAAGPVVLAVDDAQWLDDASARVLAFAWRRVAGARVGLLLARRTGEPLPVGLAELEPLERLVVGPLALDETHRLLRDRLGVVFPLPALRRVHSVSGGNPFFALEVGRRYDADRAALAMGRAPPLPERLLQLVVSRLAALPRDTREGLAAVAALSHPTPALATRFAGDDDALGPALSEHILELDGDLLRFAHPLLAAAAYEGVEPLLRRRLHRRLAALVDDEDERARLLALAAEGPDEEVAGALERAAARAQVRGLGATAAQLCEQARSLTPAVAGAARDSRALAAARYHWAAGDTDRARVVLEETVERASSGAARADALTELAWVHVFQADEPGGAALARRALDGLDEESPLRGHALNCVSTALVLMLEDLDEAARLSAMAIAHAEHRGDVEALSENLCSAGYLAALRGRPEAGELLRRAEALGPGAWGWRVIGWPASHEACISLWTAPPARSSALFTQMRQEALRRGDEGTLPTLLAHLALAEFNAGRWPVAEATASGAIEAAVQAGERQNEALAMSARSLVCAAAGRTVQARADAEGVLAMTGERSVGFARIHAHRALALIDMLAEAPNAAADRLEPLRARLLMAGVAEPGVLAFVSDLVEALVAVGRAEAAETAVEWLEERGRALDRPSALAAAERGRGMVAAAQGASDAAIGAFQRALVQHERAAVPFEHARTLLELGAAQRRARRRREARATLTDALNTFDSLGAVPWARRTTDELARISGRRPGSPGLTATERRIAALVADGRTNKEVAAALFLSPRTVEAYLRQVYRKLGVRSRTELARVALDPEDGAEPAKVQGFHRFERS
jgi:DNA-binding CsgD family transcriptional regulator